MRQLHVAAAQVHSGAGTEDTLARIGRQVHAGSVVGVDVILFAEGALHGYDYGLTPDDLGRLAEPMDGPSCDRVAEMAARYRLSILAGSFERADGMFYNSQLVVWPDGSRAVQRKHVLTKGESAAGLCPGPAERAVFEFNGVKCSVVICADCSIEGLHDLLREQGIEFRFCPAGGGGKMSEMLHEADLPTAEGRLRYEKNRPRVFKGEALLSREDCPYTGFASANALGPAGRQTCHQGHCLIVDNNRVVRAQVPGTIVLEHQQDQMIHAVLLFP